MKAFRYLSDWYTLNNVIVIIRVSSLTFHFNNVTNYIVIRLHNDMKAWVWYFYQRNIDKATAPVSDILHGLDVFIK